MPVSWLVGSKGEDVSRLMAQKAYGRAIASVRAQLQRDGANVYLRQMLADALVGSGERDEAFRILHQLADDFATEGFAAKAIAILKKMERLDPGRTDVYEKLATIIPKKEQEDNELWRRRTSSRAPVEFKDLSQPSPALSDVTPDVGSDSGEEIESAPTSRRPATLTTPLFESFTEAELMSLMRGLTLVSFAPGDIIFAEGDRDARLFIVTTGRVKAFVKSGEGRHTKVRDLMDGDFFGEISLLTGEPRTATVTAAAPTELLVLDKQTVDKIAATHPNILNILDQFSGQRLNSPEEIRARKGTEESE